MVPSELHRLRSGILLVFSYVTSGRSQEKRGRNETGTGYRYTYHFYGLVVEAGFYSDVGRVIDLFVKLSNVHLGYCSQGECIHSPCCSEI